MRPSGQGEHRDQIIGSVLYQTWRRRSVPPEEMAFLEEVHRSLGVLVATPPAAQAHPPVVVTASVIVPAPVVVPARVVVATVVPAPIVTTYSPVVIEPCRRFEVVYRTCSWEPYRVYGNYASERYAHEVARSLRHSGYHARIEVIR